MDEFRYQNLGQIDYEHRYKHEHGSLNNRRFYTSARNVIAINAGHACKMTHRRTHSRRHKRPMGTRGGDHNLLSGNQQIMVTMVARRLRARSPSVWHRGMHTGAAIGIVHDSRPPRVDLNVDSAKIPI